MNWKYIEPSVAMQSGFHHITTNKHVFVGHIFKGCMPGSVSSRRPPSPGNPQCRQQITDWGGPLMTCRDRFLGVNIVPAMSEQQAAKSAREYGHRRTVPAVSAWWWTAAAWRQAGLTPSAHCRFGGCRISAPMNERLPHFNLLAPGWKKMGGHFAGGWSYKVRQTRAGVRAHEKRLGAPSFCRCVGCWLIFF
jgi:hypothetical protein